jgi:hypothetical protein
LWDAPCMLEDYRNRVTSRSLPDHLDVGDGHYRPEAAVCFDRD